MKQCISVWAVATCFTCCLMSQAEALILKGQFPTDNGMFWNFSDNATQQEKTWTVLGRFNRSDVGPLLILARQGEGFLALQERWDGLYLCGEYRYDGFTMPEQPVMFMPFDIDFDTPLTGSTRMRDYSPGENPSITAEYDYSVIIELKALEDIVLEGREIRNCAVFEKKTRVRGVESVETFWLAPTVGPVRVSKTVGGSVKTLVLQTYGTEREIPRKGFSLKKYFPLKSGRAYDYRNQSGETVTVLFGKTQERLGYRTVPYTDQDRDVLYLGRDDRGLIVPLKYRSTMGFGFAALPPDKPPVLLPEKSFVGRLNFSVAYVRPVQWPSLLPMLDFYPESELVSVIVGIEDVTVPSGTYRDCIKICFSSIDRSYEMQRDKIRSGFIWLAPGVGLIKSEGVSLANTYLEETPDYIFQNQLLELIAIKKVDLPKAVVSEKEVDRQKAAGRPSADEVEWQGNSNAIFEAAVKEVPFFARVFARRSLMDAVVDRADNEGRVSEEAVIKAVREATPERMRAGLMEKLEQMKTL